LVDEGINPGGGVYVDLWYPPSEEMRKRSSSLVFHIEVGVEQLNRDLVCVKPFGERGHQAGLANTALSTHGQNDAFFRPCRGLFV
jgi:hypothetical protein